MSAYLILAVSAAGVLGLCLFVAATCAVVRERVEVAQLSDELWSAQAWFGIDLDEPVPFAPTWVDDAGHPVPWIDAVPAYDGPIAPLILDELAPVDLSDRIAALCDRLDFNLTPAQREFVRHWWREAGK